MRATTGWMVMVMMALGGAAAAKPGELVDVVHKPDDSPLSILEVGTTPCAVKAGVCLTPGAPTTIPGPSSEVALASMGDKPGKAAPVVPRFQRAAAVAPDGRSASTEAASWTVEVNANLKRPAWAGNALFLFFDMEDHDAIQNRQTTAFYQAPIKAGPRVAARLSLSPEEGFRAGHTYRLRIVQLINGKEIVLAEGDLSLI
jgi:hypothetical protein